MMDSGNKVFMARVFSVDRFQLRGKGCQRGKRESRKDEKGLQKRRQQRVTKGALGRASLLAVFKRPECVWFRCKLLAYAIHETC
jgi:hypothetical protein